MKRTRKADKRAELEARLAVPPIPSAAVYLWETYQRIASRRTVGMGDGPITWQDIDAFCRLTRTRLRRWEIEAIEAMDDAALKARSQE